MATQASTPSKPPALHVEPLGDQALLAVLGEGIDPGVNDRVHQLTALIRASALPGIADLIPAYANLAVHYDPVAWATQGSPYQALRDELVRLWRSAGAAAPAAPRQVEIPVCYGLEYGPDLEAVADHCKLPAEAIVARHAGAEYRVYMLGFAPGFPYLGGLDPAIAAPRRETPRLKVPAGSVGIAGMQTGIYPLESPGGWQIIGRTPRRLFQPDREEPCLLRPGDRLRFVPVDREAYLAMDRERS
ncbi:MAG: 5-oxoprolinase subunit PxpB [Holophaga sp.]|nr:5-oxoprolinase subunit PxpB [Holophaga sp.]